MENYSVRLKFTMFLKISNLVFLLYPSISWVDYLTDFIRTSAGRLSHRVLLVAPQGHSIKGAPRGERHLTIKHVFSLSQFKGKSTTVFEMMTQNQTVKYTKIGIFETHTYYFIHLSSHSCSKNIWITCIGHILYSKQLEGCADYSNQIFIPELFAVSEVRRKETDYPMKDF